MPMTLWPRQLLMSRAFAAQAGAYVILAGGINRKEDIPDRFRDLVLFEQSGDSCIIDPTGEVIAGPAEGETILLAEGSLDLVRAAKASIDIGGHYARPDVLDLSVNRTRRRRHRPTYVPNEVEASPREDTD